LIELGEKTQILIIAFTLIYQYSFELWFNSFLALILLAWIGIFLKAIISTKIPKFYLKNDINMDFYIY